MNYITVTRIVKLSIWFACFVAAGAIRPLYFPDGGSVYFAIVFLLLGFSLLTGYFAESVIRKMMGEHEVGKGAGPEGN